MMSRTKNTTYLLGAGASAKAVPLAADLPDAMIGWARSMRTDSGMARECGNHAHFRTFSKDLQTYARRAKDSGGIDAYAQVLDLQSRHSDLNKLKAVLSCWLLAWQRTGTRDIRYFPFLSTLATRGSGPSKMVFKPHSNVLSWNYDLQPEIACFHHLKMEADYITQTLAAPPHETGAHNEIDEEHFFLVRLNGCAGSHRGRSEVSGDRYTRAHSLIHLSDGSEAMRKILDLYGSYVTGDLIPAISFAWERGSTYQRFYRKRVLQALDHTTHLVIIGYSFPGTNRDVDEELLSAMTPQEIIIQDPRPDLVEPRIRRLMSGCPDRMPKITPVDQVSRFETW